MGRLAPLTRRTNEQWGRPVQVQWFGGWSRLTPFTITIGLVGGVGLGAFPFGHGVVVEFSRGAAAAHVQSIANVFVDELDFVDGHCGERKKMSGGLYDLYSLQ